MPTQTRTQSRLYRAALRLLADTGAEQVSVSDLARAAGVARGTVYNNLERPGLRFDDLSRIIAPQTETALRQLVAPLQDPAQKLSVLIRAMLRQADSDPVWGAFILRFVLVDTTLQRFWSGLPAQILEEGRRAGLFHYEGIALPSLTSQMGGAVLMAVTYVHNRRRNWDELGRETAELVLRSAGVPHRQARTAARCPLPVSNAVNYSNMSDGEEALTPA